MPGRASKVTDAFKTTLAGFTAGQKAMTALAMVAVLLGGVLFTSWATKPSLVPVFTNLESADAAAITEDMASNSNSGITNLPYKLNGPLYRRIAPHAIERVAVFAPPDYPAPAIPQE